MWVGVTCAIAFVLAALAVCAPYLPVGSRGRVCVPDDGPAAGPRVFAAVLLLLYGLSVTVRLAVFYRAHWTGSRPGSISNSDSGELARYHVVLSLLCFAVTAIMVRRLWRKRVAGTVVAGLAGLGTAGAAVITFLRTVPRSGDEGVLLWIFVGPLLLAGVAILAIMSLVTLVKGMWPRRPA